MNARLTNSSGDLKLLEKGGCFEPTKGFFGVGDDAISRGFADGFGHRIDGKSSYGALSAHAGSDKWHVSFGSGRFLALRVERPEGLSSNICAPGLWDSRELAVDHVSSHLEYRGVDADTRTSPFGGAVAGNDHLFGAFVAYACDDPWNCVAALGLFAGEI